MDVCHDESVVAGIEQVLAEWGRIDGVVNLAGNGGTLARWSDTAAHDTQSMFDVHVLGAERVLRAALPALKRQRRTVVVNIASTVAWVPMPGASAYSAAKAAVVALSETWRAELAPWGIDVRVFSPPHTRTEAGLAWPLPLPKIFEPHWVAEAFVDSLQRDHVRATPGGNGALLALQRVSPALARRIMHSIGFEALRRAETAAAER
jgi:NAD(P)-dependent dehydrogenase (short-subunit alcohol dehydrogenase family)